MIDDTELKALALDRRRLIRELGPVIGRVGPRATRRSEINKDRRVKRARIKKALYLNAELMAARIMTLFEADEYERTHQGEGDADDEEGTAGTTTPRSTDSGGLAHGNPGGHGAALQVPESPRPHPDGTSRRKEVR